MNDVSLIRLYVLRASYLLIAVGLGITVWPGVIHHNKPWELMQGVVSCVLAAVAVLAAVGLRYPLQMLPLLFFEILWKAIWLLVVAAPLWSAQRMDASTLETADACLMGVIFPFVIPWRYVWASYVTKPADRFRYRREITIDDGVRDRASYAPVSHARQSRRWPLRGQPLECRHDVHPGGRTGERYDEELLA